MTREIKFKGWNRLWKSWIVDDFTITNCGNYIYCGGDRFNRDEVDLICFTGLCDKNGKEIYEGDIVRSCIYCSKQSKHFEVLFKKDGYFVSSKHTKANWKIGEKYRLSEWIKMLDKYEIEYVGNKFENPELMEAQNANS